MAPSNNILFGNIKVGPVKFLEALVLLLHFASMCTLDVVDTEISIMSSVHLVCGPCSLLRCGTIM